MTTILKLIANALWAGAYGAVLATLLLLVLNDDLATGGLLSGAALRSLASMAFLYTLPIALALTSALGLVRFFAVRRLSAKWLSLKAIVWFGAVTLIVFTAVYNFNSHLEGALLAPRVGPAFEACVTLMAACAAGALVFAVWGQIRGTHLGRAPRWVAILLLLVPVPAAIRAAGVSGTAAREASLAAGAAPAPIVHARPRGTSGPGAVLLVGIDGASLDYILPLVSAGGLPAFESLVRQGAPSRLNTLRPCSTDVAWASILTGMPPWMTGFKSVISWSLPLGPADVRILPHGLGLRMLVRAGIVGRHDAEPVSESYPVIWETLRSAGLEGRVIGWGREGALPGRPDPVEVEAAVRRVLGEDTPILSADAEDRIGILRGAVAADLSARQAAVESGPGQQVQAIRFPGLARVSRYFLRYHDTGAFGDVSEEERAAFGRVLGGYYRFVDELLAERMAGAGPGALVMVVSPHGVEPVRLIDRLLPFGRWPGGSEKIAPSGTWESGPDGILLARGPGIGQGVQVGEADLVDVVPSLLYALGLPLDRALPGRLARDLFDPGYLEAHPVRFVSGYRPASPPGR